MLFEQIFNFLDLKEIFNYEYYFVREEKKISIVNVILLMSIAYSS